MKAIRILSVELIKIPIIIRTPISTQHTILTISLILYLHSCLHLHIMHDPLIEVYIYQLKVLKRTIKERLTKQSNSVNRWFIPKSILAGSL